jgi:hypothetical protein
MQAEAGAGRLLGDAEDALCVLPLVAAYAGRKKTTGIPAAAAGEVKVLAGDARRAEKG